MSLISKRFKILFKNLGTCESNDVHKVIKYIELKNHIYDEIEPENKFTFKAVTDNQLCKIYSKIFDESFVFEEKIDFKGEFEIDGKDYGKITDENLEKIIKLSGKSHFGKGNQTVFDENVRKAREIEGSRIRIKNFDIQKNLDNLSAKFGVKLSAKLYKLVLYQKGGHFGYHLDSVHKNSHIATLLIGLPIEYEGGNLKVNYPNDSSKFKTFKLYNNLVAFYTDCEHSISQVLDGTRVALQYDLYAEQDGEQEKAKKKSEKLNPQVINQIVKYKIPLTDINQFNSFWIDKLEKELLSIDYSKKKVAFLLRHQYANKYLYENVLKGTDKAIYESLKNYFQIDLRHVILDVEKFVDLDLFYVKCKAFKRASQLEEKDSEIIEKEQEIMENDEENENSIKLSEEIKALQIEREDVEEHEEKPMGFRIDLILTDKDRFSLIEKRNSLSLLEMMPKILMSIFILLRQCL